MGVVCVSLVTTPFLPRRGHEAKCVSVCLLPALAKKILYLASLFAFACIIVDLYFFA